MSRERLLPEIPTLSPSALDDWLRCRRLYLDRHLLRLPESDRGSSVRTGNLVHDLLRHLHGQGDCHDEALRTTVLENHGEAPDGAVATMVRRHVARCPSADARAVGHELDVVRVARRGPVWIGTGRLDAVWEHDGLLDVRDYKTGRAQVSDLAEDPRARLQAWLAAPLAPGLRLRVRYEHLGSDDGVEPVDFEPDAEDLERIEAELRESVDAIRDAAARRDFAGIADAEVCRTCSYRSICPDSASPGTPTWPEP
ncbi:MAG: PD-(D/E)XK nuclease family protein [Acidimicrobiia bacterium]